MHLAGPRHYTCPMHPEIVRDGPGSCPICGMALEPMTVPADDDVDPELAGHDPPVLGLPASRLPLLVLSMAEMVPGLSFPRLFLTGRGLGLVAVCSWPTPVVLWGGLPFFERGWASIVNRTLNMFTLIALGTGTAYRLQRSRRHCCPASFPTRFATITARSPVYFEPAAVIVTLVLLGQVLELQSPAPDRQRHPGAAGPGPQDGAPVGDDGERRGRAARAGRPATGCGSGPARRSRSTASCRGTSAVDESMITRRADPGRERARATG